MMKEAIHLFILIVVICSSSDFALGGSLSGTGDPNDPSVFTKSFEVFLRLAPQATYLSPLRGLFAEQKVKIYVGPSKITPG
jgi:hypothetical protein